MPNRCYFGTKPSKQHLQPKLKFQLKIALVFLYIASTTENSLLIHADRLAVRFSLLSHSSNLDHEAGGRGLCVCRLFMKRRSLRIKKIERCVPATLLFAMPAQPDTATAAGIGGLT